MLSESVCVCCVHLMIDFILSYILVDDILVYDTANASFDLDLLEPRSTNYPATCV